MFSKSKLHLILFFLTFVWVIRSENFHIYIKSSDIFKESKSESFLCACVSLFDSVWFVKTIIYCPESVWVRVCACVPVPPRYEQTQCNMFGRIPCREHSRQQFIIAWLPYACETVGSNLVQIQPVIHVPSHSIFPHSTQCCIQYTA